MQAKRILEIGCSRGLLGEATKLRQSCVYWGIEPEKSAFDDASARLDHIIQDDIELLDDFPDVPFDCLIFGDVLEHLRRPEIVLAKLRKNLTPDATLIANVPNIAHWTVLLELLQGKFDYTNSGLLDRTHLTFFTPDSFRKMLWNAGYGVNKEEPNLIQSSACQHIGDLAKTLGLPGEKAFVTASTYQTLFVAKLLPDATEDEGVRSKLVGPHQLQLGEANCRASAIIVTFNSSGTINTCLESVLKTLDLADEVILVDNCSTDATRAILKTWAKKDSRIKVIESSENLGFSKGNNVGILQSKGEYIVILNPDTEVSLGWIESLIVKLEDPEVGAVGPLSDQVSDRQFVTHHLPRDVTVPARELPPILQDVHEGESEETKLLIGFCLATKRSILNEVGLLDENLFLGSDDLDFSWRLSSLGYKLLIALDTIVLHNHGSSFKSLPEEQTNEYVGRSDAAFLAKLVDYYGSLDILNSELLWNSTIFEPILVAARLAAAH